MTHRPSSPSPVQEPLAPELLAQLRWRLLNERQRLLQLCDSDYDAGRGVPHEGTEDDAELASLSSDKELAYTLSDSEHAQLHEIEDALERMDLGTYGTCEHSGKAIPLARLEGLPWARYCAEYQELAEQGLLSRR